MSETKASRRSFLKTSSAAAGFAATAGGMIPSRVLGANDRLNWGVIGNGGMGTAHINSLISHKDETNLEITGVSDVYKRRLTRAEAICKENGMPNVKASMDYRNILDDKDIDVILIATPDHWHGKIAIEAMEAGKHVYIEKPITHTVEQALAVREAVKRYDKKCQVGPQRTSETQYWEAQKSIRDGKLGKVTWAQGSYNRNIRGGAFNVWFQIDESAGPHQTGEDYIDWNMWLGTEWGLQPKTLWNPEHFFRFRKYFRYNGGVATDLLYHFLAPLQLAIIGNDGEYPWRVNGNGGLYIEKDGRDIPDVFLMSIDYKSELTIFLASVLTNDQQIPTRIYGKYGTIDCPDNGADGKMTGNGDFKEEFRENNEGKIETVVPNSTGIYTTQKMEKNLSAAIRTGDTLFCNVELGVTTMIAMKMGVESYQRSKTMLWDAENEKMIEG